MLADITAYPSGITMDGFGFRAVRVRRVRAAASTYTWTSEPLLSGDWFYAVVPYDSAGNLGTPATTSVLITVPPAPPGLDDDNLRLTYTYDATDHEITLNWLPCLG